MEKKDDAHRQGNSNIKETCEQCHKKNMLLKKYQKLVHLLQRKLYQLKSGTDSEKQNNKRESKLINKLTLHTNQTLMYNKQNINEQSLNKHNFIQLKDQFRSRQSQSTQSNFQMIKFTQSTPSFFGKRVVRESKYLQIIHKLQKKIQNKNQRIQALINRLFGQKNLYFYLRTVIYEFLRTLNSIYKINHHLKVQNNDRTWQIMKIILQIFEYSEQEMQYIFNNLKFINYDVKRSKLQL